MRTSWDALRSLTKYAAAALDEDVWEVRFAYEEGAFRRPFARIATAGDAQYTGPKYETTIVQPFNITCHPVETESADLAVQEAERVREVLVHAFRFGVAWVEAGEEVGGWPMRVPLWDYDGIPLGATSTKRGYADYLRITAFSVDITADPNDEQLRAVSADIRMSWRRMGPVPFGRRTLVSVRSDFDSP